MSLVDRLRVALWRDVSRHLEIRESAAGAARLLAAHMPLCRLSVFRFDAEHHRVVAATEWPAGGGGVPAEQAPLPRDGWQKLLRWQRQGRLLHLAADDKKREAFIELLARRPTSGDAILVPLAGEHGSQGTVLAVAGHGREFSRRHIELLEALREPLGVALDNDARLRELATLRQAAEADRQSLLRRLGRSDVVDAIVGENAGLAQVMQRVDLVSRSAVPVLILGETGTGKELVARAIHTRSERHSGPFLRVNCGAIPRDLIDSQLFGHERGAFTGASETRQGWFERADRGTLFLDEIGELPLEAQVRFLRVLQDGFVERVGGSQAIRVDVRVVAATHRNLAEMVRAGGFREDLWYRIAVFPILLPPLRDRLDDIPELARHFAQRAAIRFGLAPVEPTDADIVLLQGYDWPGNIRELGAVIDRAAILGNGGSLELAAALGLAAPRGPYASRELPASTPHSPARGSRIVPLSEAMRAHIEAALRSTRGRIEGPRGAARLLFINPHTLRARMRKLKIDWSAFRERNA
jgi:transcriptional regulator with GAF, ATPase, and Fis domain